MSHITHVELQVTSLEALKSACATLGLTFHEGQKQYNCYMSRSGEANYKRNYPDEWERRPQNVEHVISVPGTWAQIAVNKRESGYTLHFDEWDPNLQRQEDSITSRLGKGLEKVKQMYAVSMAKIQARVRGWNVASTTLKNGSIKLVMSGVS